MPRKSLILTLVLTAVLMFVSARLYVSQEFWDDWDTNYAYLEVYNTGQKDNSFVVLDRNKVKIEMPDELTNPTWVENAGVGLMLQYKVRSVYREYSAVLKALGDGKLKIRFSNFEWNTEPKDIKIHFRNIKINDKSVLKHNVFSTGEILSHDFDIKNGDVVKIEFAAMRYWGLKELFIQCIDWCMFIILLTLAFFVSYKVVRYLAKFKLHNNISRIDIVFVTMFFSVLFIPMSHISKEDKSDSENRVLAKYHRLYDDGGINFRYGGFFDKWFNDRFFGREKLIKLHSNIVNNISLQGNEKVMVGKDNWLFMKSAGSIDNFRNMVSFSDKELKHIASYLSAINDWCKSNGKDFYYVICPDKNKVYGEYIKYITKLKPDSESRTWQLINYLKANTDIKVIYLQDVLLDNKDDNLLYFKNDTHWTSMGGYVGYVELMKKIKEKYQDYRIVTFDKTKKIKNLQGDLAKMYPAAPVDTSDYVVPDFNSKAICRSNVNKRAGMFCRNTNLTKKLVLYRDSFSGGWLDYLNETFGKVTAFWRYDVNRDDLQYWKNEADIIIMEQLERFVPMLADYKFPE